ncbi:MAG: SDR family oxidoreductase [Bdellovibrionales bacterium]|nr:SDR family oxidoreductase [Bdellovibrionales bacterium]
MQTHFKDLEGKWALVLGASSGFGAAVSTKLAQSGMNICGVHLDRKATMGNVEQLITEIQSHGVKAMFFNVNAADAEKRKEVLDTFAKESEAGFHILFHSLAFGTLKPYFSDQGETQSLNASQMSMTLDVMAHSLVYWAQELISRGQFNKGGRVFAMTSAGGERVWKTYGAVSAAKASLESHIRQMALELATYGISANAIRAGVTDTPALRKIPGNEQMIEMAKSKNPYGRLTTPEDVAQAVVTLSLPHCHWISGNVIGVDGGENIVD